MRLKTILVMTLTTLLTVQAAHADVDTGSVTERLNADPLIDQPETSKGWRILFDAYMGMTSPPREVGPGFNLNTIWPGMEGWSAASDWAAANSAMADAIIEASDRTVIGLPYGSDNVPATYRSKGIVIEIWADGNVRNNNFSYLKPLEEIIAYSTAETYRRLESGEIDEALALTNAQLRLLRKFCDRDFLIEKKTCMQLLIDSLRNMRDYFYAYGSKMPQEQLRDIARKQIPRLRPDKSRLFIPEGDRIVAEEIFSEVFDKNTDRAKPEKFLEVFTEIQAEQEPLSRFGASRRWKELAEGPHGSHSATKQRLQNIFDDWWRRWRLREYSQVLGVETEFDKTNPTRYAAAIFIVNDLTDIFALRDLLLVEARGTITAAGLCYYHNTRGKFPPKLVALYPDPLSKQYVKDVFHEELSPFQYRFVDSRMAVDVNTERRWVEPGECILYSMGPNKINDSQEERHPVHSDHKDLLLWPPVKSLEREVTPSP